MKPVIACRDSVYTTPAAAFRLLPDTGITHVELSGVDPARLADVQKVAAVKGVTISTVGSSVALSDAASIETYGQLIDAAGACGIAKLFTSIGAHEAAGRAACMSALRDLAGRASAAGARICMETHPPFAFNAAEARRTIEEVGSDALRLNFDTANVYYYNEAMDGARELDSIKDLVASIHLKDTDGGFHLPNFPVFGEGIVDFRTVFAIGGEIGLEGPYTMELEGPLTNGKSDEERHASVKACMDHLESIGVI